MTPKIDDLSLACTRAPAPPRPRTDRIRNGALGALLLATCAPAVWAGPAQGFPPAEPAPADASDVRILPFGWLPHVRDVSRPVDVQVQVLHSGSDAIRLRELRVTHDGVAMAQVPLDDVVRGDGGEWLRLHRLAERVEPHESGRYVNRTFVPIEEAIAKTDAEHESRDALLEELRDGLLARQDERDRPFRNVSFSLPLPWLFPKGTAPGTEAPCRIEIIFEREGVLDSASTVATTTLLAAYAGPPDLLQAALGAGPLFASVDLHVHNCRDESIGGCPSCPAETLNVSAAFTNAQLKSQYQALGLEAFASTSHSYCLEDPNEYVQLQGEATQLTDSTFVLLPDTELSSLESGPQQGSDLGDAICFLGGGSPTNHMGAHGITSWKPGGGDGVFQMCSPPITAFDANIVTINAEGGFAIANHPSSGSWGWNSFAATQGLEAGAAGLTGVEIWNGPTRVGQGGDVAWWVSNLLAGRLLYAYSGSDTHDAAFDFGATHVLVPTLDPANLAAGLRAGRAYVSNGDFLVIFCSILGGAITFVMGDRIPFPPTLPPGIPVDVIVFYNLQKTGKVDVLRGRQGDSSEVLLGGSAGLSGKGFLWFTDTIHVAGNSWYRGYSESNDQSRVAYTNPVFFVRG